MGYQTGFNSNTGLVGMTKEKLISLSGYRLGLYMARLRINYTQEYVSHVSGLSRGAYSDIERGMCLSNGEPRDCNGMKWCKLADCLNVEDIREIMAIWTYDIVNDRFIRNIKKNGRVLKYTYEEMIGADKKIK